jgi:hypothetical protein
VRSLRHFLVSFHTVVYEMGKTYRRGNTVAFITVIWDVQLLLLSRKLLEVTGKSV